MTSEAHSLGPGAVAIIGMAGRFPSATTVRELWRLLRQGQEATRWFTDEELIAAGVSAAALRDPNYVKAGMVLPDMEAFDADFFGFSPREASILDPQHRHFLECAWETLEDAGHMPETFKGAIGVFAGCGMQAYMAYNLLTNPDLLESVGLFLLRHTGNDKDFLTTRASYLLNLQGPSVSVQTACSTSLVAVHMAAQSLLSGECDMALAGGVSIELPHRHGYRYVEGEILSPDGHCRAFDDDSKGTIFGSGVGLVALRRLDDALADGDNIYAVIRGSAINNDGSQKAGYLAPSVEGQARAAAEAIAVAGVDPGTITYIETHGTGTPVGDPIELAALKDAYGASPRAPCLIGSIKTNIGHLDTAAGVAALIKVALALKNGELPASLNFSKPNSRFDFAASPFKVASERSSWRGQPGLPRRAGVNSLGVGGTNAHVIVEEAPSVPASRPAREWQVFALSAKTATSLDGLRRKWSAFVKDEPDFSVSDAAYTTQEGRRAFQERCVVIARDAEGLSAALDSRVHRRLATGTAPAEPPPVTFMFPGGGAQYPGMGQELYLHDTAFRHAVDECFAVMPREAPADLRAVLFERSSGDREAQLTLERPTYAIPALFVVEYATARMWQSWGVQPASLIGHSAGEYAAACIAGVLSVRDALSIVVQRGIIFEEAPPGAMLAVALSEEKTRPWLGETLEIAAVNAPEFTVATGPLGAIEALEQKLVREGIEAKRLRINVAAHSCMLNGFLSRFRETLGRIHFRPPTIPFVSNLTGTLVEPETLASADYWVKHLRQPVRFAAGLQTLLARPGMVLLEVGPGQALGSLARLNGGTHRPLAVLPSLRQAQDDDSDLAFALTSAGRLWTLGQTLTWDKVRGGGTARRIPAPTYAFEKKRYWIEPGQGRATEPRDEHAAHGLQRLANRKDWFWSPGWERTNLPPGQPDPAARWLVFADGTNASENLLGHLRRRGIKPTIVRSGDTFRRGEDSFSIRPASVEDHIALLSALEAEGLLPERIIHLWSLSAPPPSTDHPDLDQELLFGSLFAVCRALQHLAVDEEIRIGIVTSGSQAVAGEALPRPERATLLGPALVAPREFTRLTIQVIDIPAGGAEGLLGEQVLAEFDAATKDELVVLRDGARWTRRINAVQVEAADGIPTRLREGGVYLITGGLGGLGLALAGYLARTVRARIALVSRRPVPPKEQWSSVEPSQDGTDTAIISALRDIEHQGGDVIVVHADVADPAAMRSAVDQVRAQFGSVHGVFHAAGVLDDAPIATKTPESLRQVLAPKLRGGQVLDELFPRGSLDLFAVFSSTSALLGPAGQIDYAAANAFLDALAGARPDGLAINWGIWSDIGMAAKAAGATRDRSSPREEVRHPLVGSEVRRTSTGITFLAEYNAADLWVLSEHKVAGRAILPGVAYIELARAALSALPDVGIVDIKGLTFSAPLALGPGETRLVRTSLEANSSGAYDLLVESSLKGGSEWLTHATATISPAIRLPASVQQDAVAAAQSDGSHAVQGLGTPQPGAVAFGPRWQNVRWVEVSPTEAIGEFELPEAFRSDLDTWMAHPALVDMAATIGLHLVDPKTSSEIGSVYVPISVGHVHLHRGAWPKRVRSLARLTGRRDDVLVSFDVTIADLAGEPLLTLGDLALSRVSHDVMRQSSAAASPRPLDTLLQAGIYASDAEDLFNRILSSPHKQLVVSSIALPDLRQVMAAAAAPKRALPSRAAPAALTYANEVESQIASFWTELLGVPQVRPDDNFFDLGGFSLVAVRLFAKIRKQFGVELPLASLFRAPTLRELSDLVRELAGLPSQAEAREEVDAPKPSQEPARIVSMPTSDWSPLVPICRGLPHKPSLYCVHGGRGNVLNFSAISRKLGRDQPFYGLQAQGVDGVLPPLRTIEEMAATYIASIQTMDPEGPYCLAGYSGGGVVAFEMARQLQRAGHSVPLLVMFDTLFTTTSNQFGTLEKIWSARHWSLSFALNWPKRELQKRRDLAALKRMQASARPNQRLPDEILGLYLYETYLEAQRAYRPEPLPVDLILFRAKEAGIEYLRAGPTLGWDNLIEGRIEVHEVPCNHETMMSEPAVDEVAAILRRKLEILPIPSERISA
ncbi:MAG TPA: SDR family NAD(P)-dependent oxidoreductase [Microvirga sp.]|jgi:acyl transferase domain-containing protein/thioesterase domain-containing protein|nr:SDR family NAD(P)-dependent oxidoreductase [Microvirga sp.]